MAKSHPVTTGIGPCPAAKLGFAAGKELTGLDEHQVHCWTSWHRWTILALLACAFLSVQAAARACHYRRRALTPT